MQTALNQEPRAGSDLLIKSVFEQLSFGILTQVK